MSRPLINYAAPEISAAQHIVRLGEKVVVMNWRPLEDDESPKTDFMGWPVWPPVRWPKWNGHGPVPEPLFRPVWCDPSQIERTILHEDGERQVHLTRHEMKMIVEMCMAGLEYEDIKTWLGIDCFIIKKVMYYYADHWRRRAIAAEALNYANDSYKGIHKQLPR